MAPASGVAAKVAPPHPQSPTSARHGVAPTGGLRGDFVTRRTIKSIAPNYSGPLDVTLSLLVSQTGVYEVLARMTPPARPDRPAKPDDFKGIQFTYPTGIAATAAVTGTPRSPAAK